MGNLVAVAPTRQQTTQCPIFLRRDQNDDSTVSSATLNEMERRHHKNLARMFKRPWIQVEAFLWKEVGGMYPYLDIPSGFCFLVGSLLFSIAPLLRMLLSEDAYTVLDWLNLSGVILYTVAKALVELRAIYAHLFKGPSARVSAWYHAAVIGLLVGGLLFGAYVILHMKHAGAMSLARTSLSSSAFFVIGSAAFVRDAFPHAYADRFQSAPSNSYFLGSLLFLLGSVCWLVGSSLLFPVLSYASPELDNVFNFLAGAMFVFGSICYLILGYFEMKQFNRGPNLNLPAVQRRCKELGIDPDPASNKHFHTTAVYGGSKTTVDQHI